MRVRPRSSARAAAGLGAVALLTAASASAWTGPFHESVALQSARLMPPSLESVLAEHSARLRKGATAPLALRGHESLYLHENDWGRLDEAVLAQTQRLLDLLSGRAPMSAVAYEMGVLSHYVAVAQDPTHCSADDPREAEWAPSFHRFAESRIPRFRVVFDGYLAEPLERDDVKGFVRGLFRRSRVRYPILSRSYLQEDGRVLTSASFDDRHPVYGVASLGYSRAISDTAKLWLYAWVRSGGDTTRLPFPQGLRNVPLPSSVGQ